MLVKSISFTQICEMLETAISQLTPIHFENEGLSGSFLPAVCGYSGVKNPKFLGIAYSNLPVFICLDAENHDFLNLNCVTECDFSNQESVNSATRKLWEKERADFNAENWDVEKLAWSQGSNYFDLIKDIASNPTYQTVSWSKFCEFSQTFTNANHEEREKFKPEFVYLDNSGGFKIRGAWSNRLEFKYFSSHTMCFEMPAYQSIESEWIEHFFGSWEAYAPEAQTIFLFQSCNGNSLVGWVNEDLTVDIFLNNPECNYAKFFKA